MNTIYFDFKKLLVEIEDEDKKKQEFLKNLEDFLSKYAVNGFWVYQVDEKVYEWELED